jgi:putative flippase GtrA
MSLRGVSRRVVTATPLRFLGVGALNTLAGLAVIYVGMGLFGLDEITSNALGYGCGITLSFVLNRRWTFGHSGAAMPALLKFLATIGVAYAANLAAVVMAVDAGLNTYAAQALGIPIYTSIAYWGSHRYAFAASRGPEN